MEVARKLVEQDHECQRTLGRTGPVRAGFSGRGSGREISKAHADLVVEGGVSDEPERAATLLEPEVENGRDRPGGRRLLQRAQAASWFCTRTRFTAGRAATSSTSRRKCRRFASIWGWACCQWLSITTGRSAALKRSPII